jgi:hypothetical protein
MPQIRFSINQRTSKEIAQLTSEKIRDIVVAKAREKFKRKIKDDVADVIDGTISSFGPQNLVPDNNEAYELGIGEGGQVDEERRLRAWETLLVGEGRGVIKLSTRKGEGKTGIGNLQVNIDYEKFYGQDECIIPTPDSKVIDEIPWMRWFLEGMEIQGHKFLGTSHSKVSRTGGGIMIVGGLWSIKPRSFIINNLQVALVDAINKYIKRFVVEEISNG